MFHISHIPRRISLLCLRVIRLVRRFLLDQSTCTRAIGHLRGAFSDQGHHTSADTEIVLDEFIELANGIQRALFEFDSTSNHAVLRLYQRADVHGSTSHGSTATASATSEENPNPFLPGGEGEHVFLVYLWVDTPSSSERRLFIFF